MPIFDVHVLIRDCFVPERLRISSDVEVIPTPAPTPTGELEVVSSYISEEVDNRPPPPDVAGPMLEDAKSRSAGVAIAIYGVKAANAQEAKEVTQPVVERLRDVVAFRQYYGGEIFAVYTIQEHPTAAPSTVNLVVHPPRRVFNLPVGETEADVVGRLLKTSLENPTFAYYLTLFHDAVRDASVDFRVSKLWTLFEAMSVDYPGTKQQKVRSLLLDYNIGCPQYGEHDLIELSYRWRNCTLHEGGLASIPTRSVRCERLREKLADKLTEVADEIADLARFTLWRRARALAGGA